MEGKLSQQHDEEQRILHVYWCHLLSMSCKNNLRAAYLEFPIPQEETYLSALATSTITNTFSTPKKQETLLLQTKLALKEQKDTGVNGCSVI